MTKAIIKFVDGDSGEMRTTDGISTKTTRIRLSGVRSPEKVESGYGAAKMRATHLVHEDEIVDVKIVGKDTYDRAIIEITKNGRDVNEILERYNKLFRPSPPKTKKRPSRRQSSPRPDRRQRIKRT